MFENISVKYALKLAYEGKAILYDLRDEDSYKMGHLPTAIRIEEDSLEQELGKWIKKNDEFDVNAKYRILENYGKQEASGKKIILYCDYGNRSLRLAKELTEKGYDNIASIVGGYQAYEGYVERKKSDFWTMEWKEKSVDSRRLDK